MKQPDHNRSSQIHFYRMGLSVRDGFIKGDNEKKWPVKTLSSFYQWLKTLHGAKPIDYLKIDIEGNEWTALMQIMSSGILDRVKQLALEVHFNWPGTPDAQQVRRRLEIIGSLERDHGFAKFDYRNNLNSQGSMVQDTQRNYFACAEVVFLNTKFLRQ